MKLSSLRIRNLFLSFFLFFAVAAAAFAKDSIRVTEKNERYPGDSARTAAAGALYVPRQAVKGIFTGVAKTASELSDPDFIRRVKDILYLYKRDLMWFPILDYNSGFRPSSGAGLYYKKSQFKALLKGAIYDSELWSTSLKVSHRHTFDNSMQWDNSLLGIMEKQDDLRFYGFGADPKNDSRNNFLSNQDYGTFSQDRRKLQWTSSLYPKESWGFTYTGYFQRRAFQDHGRGNDDLRNVFDSASIPGFTVNAPVSQLYNEGSLHVDTRDQKKIISPGFRGEVYSGIATGLGKNKTELYRVGGDAAAFLPVMGRDRVLVPRAMLDVVENFDGEDIPFSEYPRQRTFRGVSEREWIRTDRVSFVPSLEYQWPLSHLFTGSLFFDYMAVGESLGSIGWNNGLWAAGGGINLHYLKHELGRIELAGGSEGVQLSISFGRPLRSNARTGW